VAGPKAAQYEFTSARPVRLLGVLLPVLSPLIDTEEGVGARVRVAPIANATSR